MFRMVCILEDSKLGDAVRALAKAGIQSVSFGAIEPSSERKPRRKAAPKKRARPKIVARKARAKPRAKVVAKAPRKRARRASKPAEGQANVNPAIRAGLSAMPFEFRLKELIAATHGLRRGLVDASLRRLQRHGEVEKVRYGLYRHRVGGQNQEQQQEQPLQA